MPQPDNGKKENSTSVALTSIHETYTLPTTQSVEEIVKNKFFQTLAEIAIAIATRKAVSAG